MNDSLPSDGDENPRISDAAAADSSPPSPPADDRTEPEPEPAASSDSAGVEEHDAEPVGESTELAGAIPNEPDQEEVGTREPEPATETPAAEMPESAPASPEEIQPDEATIEPMPSESEAKPKVRKPRKSKAAASGADGPDAAPASTDPNVSPGGETAGESGKKWYVVKVQSGREDSIKSAIERKVKIEGLEPYFGQIAIPVEEIVVKRQKKTTDKKTGEKVTKEEKVVKHQKKYPGYLFAEVEFNDRILFLFRDTSGVGDFVGAGLKREPTPMTDREVTQMLTGVVDKDAKKGSKGPMKVKLDIEKGDKVKIRDGAFANMEGEVKAISEAKEDAETPKVTVVVTIFGRPVEVELDYWHVDKV